MDSFVSLTFKDTNSAIEFDLNKNTLFFGNNGRGKTRILKTIESLYKLLHQSDSTEAYNLIEKMYLKELTVGNFDCINLFKNSDSIKSQNLKQLSRFFIKYNLEFQKIYKGLKSFRNVSVHSLYKNNKIFYSVAFFEELEKLMNKLKKIYTTKKNTANIFEDLFDFENFIRDLEGMIHELGLSQKPLK